MRSLVICVILVGSTRLRCQADDWAAPTTKPRMTGAVNFEPTENEAQTARLFRLGKHAFAFEVTDHQSGAWIRLVQPRAVIFPSPVVTPFECNNTVHCEYFSPRGKTPCPGVVVLHILGGDFELSRAICRILAMHGVGALFVKMPYYGPRRPAGRDIRMISADLELTTQNMRQAVLDIRRATAWLGAQNEIDPQRLGIAGISLGGIVAALATSAEPRLSRACLVLAGGDLMTIIMESKEMAGIREQWAGKTFDRDQVAAQLRSVDPLTYSHQLRRRQLLMFNARNDEVIPPACSRALWKAVGEPEIEWWDANHYSAAWFLPRGMSRMITFFREE